MVAPLLSFLWICSGSNTWAGVQEVQVPDQARRCLVECVNLWGLPPGSSATTAWISLQDGEHIHRAIYFIFTLKEDNGEEEALTV